MAATLLLFALCSAASAQDYQIRTDANINLRNTYSLEGVILETVPSGTVLQVVGRFNRWLKIDRDGLELWMADWVRFTRVTGSDGTQTQTGTRDSGQTQSKIDNCCFVDRQCSADADWVSGYWAFQNNQCNVAGRTIASFLIPGSGPAMEGSAEFVSQLGRTLRFLKIRAPKWHAYVTSGLDKLREVHLPQGSSVAVESRTAYISLGYTGRGNNESAFTSLSGTLVHEACHVHRHEARIPYIWGPDGEIDKKEELACMKKQLQATVAVDPHDRFEFAKWLRIDIASDFWN